VHIEHKWHVGSSAAEGGSGGCAAEGRCQELLLPQLLLPTCAILPQQQQQVEVAQVVGQQEAGAVGIHGAVSLQNGSKMQKIGSVGSKGQ